MEHSCSGIMRSHCLSSPAVERFCFLPVSGAAAARGCRLGGNCRLSHFCPHAIPASSDAANTSCGNLCQPCQAPRAARYLMSPLPQLVLAASLLAGMAWVILALFRRSKQQRWGLNNPLPFGPFLTAAGFWCGWQTSCGNLCQPCQAPRAARYLMSPYPNPS
jgi:hypothetical protein